VFQGESTINLDSKGRLAVPARFRAQIAEHDGDRLVFTYSAADEGCLWLYPLPEWERIRDELGRLRGIDEAEDALKRRLVGCAEMTALDAAGRVLLPLSMRQRCALEGKVVMMGMVSRFEIWNAEVIAAKVARDAELIRARATEAISRLRL